MRNTTAIEKLIPSLINGSIAIVLSLPALLHFGVGLEWKLSAVTIFFIIQLWHTYENRGFTCFGMRIFGTTWEKHYSRVQETVYVFLYTLSFSTLFFSVLYPFDLFLLNIFLLQLPTVLLTGTTFHGYLSGGMKSQRAL